MVSTDNFRNNKYVRKTYSSVYSNRERKDNYIYYRIEDKKQNIKEVKSQLDGSDVQKVDENTLDEMFVINYTNMEDYYILWP